MLYIQIRKLIDLVDALFFSTMAEKPSPDRELEQANRALWTGLSFGKGLGYLAAWWAMFSSVLVSSSFSLSRFN